MCGIYGFFAKTERFKFYKSDMEDMAQRIVHRGPDGTGIHFEENKAGIGNVRLAIIDPIGGDQPFYSDDGSVVLVQNGEIFNFRELKAELEVEGYRFTSNCDTEVLLKLYLKDGISFLNKLNGMFAIAIYHTRENKLILARDRIGEKPLYFTESADSFYFASEIKSFLPYIEKEIDLTAINAFLELNYIPAPLTGFSNVFHLLPGNFMEISGDGVETKEWWDLSTQVQDSSLAEDEWQKEFLDLLDDCVSMRLVSDVPFGAFLSGGVDSSSVVGLMSKHLDSPVKTYTIGFPDKRFDESVFAKEASVRFNTEHKMKEVDYDIIDEWSDFIYHCDKPHGDVSFMPMRKVSQLAAKDVKMVLTGDGADELFAGYEKYVNVMNRRTDSTKSEGSLLEDVLSEFSLLNKELLDSIWRDEYRLQIEPDKVKGMFQSALDRVSHFDEINKVLYLEMKYLLSGNNLVKPDRMAMAESLETRAPFLDYRMMEFAFRTPGIYKLKDGDKKRLFKSSVVPLIGENLAFRKKQMFTMPIGEWFKASLSQYCEEILLSDDSRLLKLFNKTVIEELLVRHLAGSHNNTREIRALISIELWLRRFY